MTELRPRSDAHTVSTRQQREVPRRHIEWRVINLPSDVSRAAASALLTEQAEYGQWELARSVLYRGGARRIWLKRRIIKLQRTDVRY